MLQSGFPSRYSQSVLLNMKISKSDTGRPWKMAGHEFERCLVERRIVKRSLIHGVIGEGVLLTDGLRILRVTIMKCLKNSASNQDCA